MTFGSCLEGNPLAVEEVAEGCSLTMRSEIGIVEGPQLKFPSCEASRDRKRGFVFATSMCVVQSAGRENVIALFSGDRGDLDGLDDRR
jgi:hypothetical protein